LGQVDDDTLLVPRNVDALLATLNSTDKLLLGYMIEAEIDATTKKFDGKMYLLYPLQKLPHKNSLTKSFKIFIQQQKIFMKIF
jgi:hypothetical protein